MTNNPTMDKLTEFIQAFRISRKTKNGLIEMARADKRTLRDFLRIILDKIVLDFMSKKEST